MLQSAAQVPISLPSFAASLLRPSSFHCCADSLRLPFFLSLYVPVPILLMTAEESRTQLMCWFYLCPCLVLIINKDSVYDELGVWGIQPTATHKYVHSWRLLCFLRGLVHIQWTVWGKSLGHPLLHQSIKIKKSS